MNNILIFKIGLVALLLSTDLFSQQEATRFESYTSQFTPGDELELSNQFGDVKINHWQKDSIKISYEIIGKAKDQEFAEEIMNRIQVEIISVFNGVLVKTDVEKSDKNWLKNWWSLNQPFNKPNVQVHFDVYLPRNSKLEISNKYGDLILPETVEQLRAEVKYGDIRGGDILNYSELQHTQGKLLLSSFKGKINARNVEIRIGESSDLNVTSTNSNFDIKSVQSLHVNSTHDEGRFQYIERLSGTVNNSDITIDSVTDQVNTSLKNSYLYFNKIETGAEQVTIDQRSSSIEFLELPHAYHVQFTMEDGTVKLPAQLENLDVNMLDKRKNLREITAGNVLDTSALQISISGNKGNIFIK